MKKIKLGTASFEDLIVRGSLYVDKTAYVYEMVKKDSVSDFYFLSRPRRFGKSLMCSTLAALFNGRKDLFEGLYIAGTDYGFEKYPVLRFDFSKLGGVSYEDFLTNFTNQIASNAKKSGVGALSGKPSTMFDSLLGALEERAVIIIDEFDSPIIDAVSQRNRELADLMKAEFNAFYKVIKANTEKIRFFFMTGCTKLSGLNIFSAMNNLKDVSRHSDYAGMFGYTEDELEENFDGYINSKISESGGRYSSRSEFLGALRNYYDGYRFSPDSEVRVYNPVSIGNYFSDPTVNFSNYWMETGGISTLAITLAKNFNLVGLVDGPVGIDADSLGIFDISDLLEGSLTEEKAIACLYYAGYLTIVGVDPFSLQLYFPNTEVESAFTKLLVDSYSGNPGKLALRASKVLQAALEGDCRTMLEEINGYYKAFTYQDLKGNKEQMVKVIFKAFFLMLNVSVGTEVDTGPGRADIVMKTPGFNYILEFKVDSATSAEALAQIKEKNYPWVLNDDKRPLHLIGVDFRTAKGQIVSYSHQIHGSPETEEVALF